MRVFHEQCMGSILCDPRAKLSNASMNSGSTHFLHKRAQTKRRVNTPTRSFLTVCAKSSFSTQRASHAKGTLRSAREAQFR